MDKFFAHFVFDYLLSPLFSMLVSMADCRMLCSKIGYSSPMVCFQIIGNLETMHD